MTQEDRQRVKEKLEGLVISFLRARGYGATFNLNELVLYVMQQKLVSPSSPGRILQLLKRDGKIDYEVVSRSQSLYRIISTGEFR